MKIRAVRFLPWMTVLAACALIHWSVVGAMAREVVYPGLNPDAFMKDWLVLDPIAVSNDAVGPDEALQKKVFADDLLAAAGGETGVSPKDGSTVTIAAREHA